MSDFRLRRERIIKRSDVFNELFESGVRLHSDHILLLFLASDQCRVGFAVSQKIKGVARRNRAKRRLREVLRLNQDKLPQKMNIVLVAKPGIERVKFEILDKEFLSLLRKLVSKAAE
ncbi:MAG: ribonuclease P protein component [bacterium]